MASYYHGRTGLTAAHRTLPFLTRVRVTNMVNGRSAIVLVSDRGPFTRSWLIHLSYPAASAIGMTGQGITRVQLEVVE
jgi:rare lipoprotein A